MIDEIIRQQFAKNLKTLRYSKQLTQGGLANELSITGITPMRISELENEGKFLCTACGTYNTLRLL